MTTNFYKKNGKRYTKFAEQFNGFPNQGVFLVKNGLMNDIQCLSHINDVAHLEDIPSTQIDSAHFYSFLTKKAVAQGNVYNIQDIAQWTAIYLFGIHSNNPEFDFDFKKESPISNSLPTDIYVKPLFRYKLVEDINNIRFPMDGVFVNYNGGQTCILSKESYHSMPDGFLQFALFSYALTEELRDIERNPYEIVKYIVETMKKPYSLTCKMYTRQSIF